MGPCNRSVGGEPGSGWRAVSADDGHLTSGAFSFGVGRFAGVLPGPRNGSPVPNPLQAGASWLVVGGAAAALGGLSAPRRGARTSPLVIWGLGLALGGAVVQTVVVLAAAGTSPPRAVGLALALRFRAEAATVLAAVAAGAVLAQVGPPSPGVAATDVLGPPPLAGPLLRTAGLAGDLTVGLAVGAHRLQVEVYAGRTQVAGTTLVVTREAGAAAPGPVGGLVGCGAGCFSAPFDPPTGGRLAVAASAPGWRGGVWVADETWPPPAQDPAALRAVVATVRGLPRVHVVETVRTAGGQAPPTSEDVTGAALLRDEPWANGAEYVTALPGGRGVFVYLPGGPIWDTITLDGTGRPLTEEIVTSGNRIDRRFDYL